MQHCSNNAFVLTTFFCIADTAFTTGRVDPNKTTKMCADAARANLTVMEPDCGMDRCKLNQQVFTALLQVQNT